MSKQYKLLKWYPGLCRDWEVGMEVEIGDRGGGLYSPCSSKYTDACVIGSHVEKNSEYWQEIKQYKEPLFKDFLGNEVMEGEEFYFVNPMFWDVEKGKALYGALKKEIAHFKFKKDAENYKEQNKPIYSKKQVLDTLSKSCNYLGAVFLAESIKKDLGL